MSVSFIVRSIVISLLAVSTLGESAYAAHRYAIVRRDGTYVVEPQLGRIESIGRERFTYGVLEKSSQNKDTYSVWIVEPTGGKTQVKQPTGCRVKMVRGRPSIAAIQSKERGGVYFYTENGKILSESGNVLEKDSFVPVTVKEFADERYSALTSNMTRVPDFNRREPGDKDRFIVFPDGKTEGSKDAIEQFRGVIDEKGNIVLPCEYDRVWGIPSGFVAERDNRFYIFDQNGKKTLTIPETIKSFQIGSEDLITVSVKGPGTKTPGGHRQFSLSGYIDRSGKFVIEPKFLQAGVFTEGLASAWVEDSMGDGKCGLIDKSGAWVIEPKYMNIEPGKNLFSAIISDPHYFSSKAWAENKDHEEDLLKLFRDKRVIGMSRNELLSLLGPPANIKDTYCRYVISSGTDTAKVIDFDFDTSAKVYRWRVNMLHVFDSETENWCEKNQYP